MRKYGKVPLGQLFGSQLGVDFGGWEIHPMVEGMQLENHSSVKASSWSDVFREESGAGKTAGDASQNINNGMRPSVRRRKLSLHAPFLLNISNL